MLGVECKGLAMKTSLSFVYHHTQPGSQVLSDHVRLMGTLFSAESEQALESGQKEDRYFIWAGFITKTDLCGHPRRHQNSAFLFSFLFKLTCWEKGNNLEYWVDQIYFLVAHNTHIIKFTVFLNVYIFMLVFP